MGHNIKSDNIKFSFSLVRLRSLGSPLALSRSQPLEFGSGLESMLALSEQKKFQLNKKSN